MITFLKTRLRQRLHRLNSYLSGTVGIYFFISSWLFLVAGACILGKVPYAVSGLLAGVGIWAGIVAISEAENGVFVILLDLLAILAIATTAIFILIFSGQIALYIAAHVLNYVSGLVGYPLGMVYDPFGINW